MAKGRACKDMEEHIRTYMDVHIRTYKDVHIRTCKSAGG